MNEEVGKISEKGKRNSQKAHKKLTRKLIE